MPVARVAAASGGAPRRRSTRLIENLSQQPCIIKIFNQYLLQLIKYNAGVHILMAIQTGFVAILDALGVSSYTIEEAEVFNSKKIQLLTALNEANIQNRSTFELVSRRFNAEHDIQISFPEMTVTTFGDSIIISWKIEEGVPPEYILPVVAIWIENAIFWGLHHHILLRGAISVGKCLIDNSAIANTASNTTIIGPAIADANAWAQEADWFGVILTPRCQLSLAKMLENRDNSIVPIDLLFVKYSVPLHNNQGKKELYAISWPSLFLFPPSGVPVIGLYGLTKKLSKFDIPKGKESKYENSIAFFKNFEENVFPSIMAQAQSAGMTPP
jgi:hypothetical protein